MARAWTGMSFVQLARFVASLSGADNPSKVISGKGFFSSVLGFSKIDSILSQDYFIDSLYPVWKRNRLDHARWQWLLLETFLRPVSAFKCSNYCFPTSPLPDQIHQCDEVIQRMDSHHNIQISGCIVNHAKIYPRDECVDSVRGSQIMRKSKNYACHQYAHPCPQSI